MRASAARGPALELLRRGADQIGPRPGLLARELAYRAARSGRRLLLWRRYEQLTRARGARLRPPAAAPLPAAEGLPAELAAGAVAVREYADAAALGRFDILGSGPLERGEPIDWSSDPLSRFRWPAADYREVRAATPPGADLKQPWELSRCHHFVALARAHSLFGEPRHLEALGRQWDSWLQANPPGVGVNWANPMEVAIRAVNWAWTLGELGGTAALPAGLGPRIADSLERHGRHLRWNLEGSPRLRSNHFLGDVLGLLVIGASLEGTTAERWLRFARRALEREIHLQVGADGVGFEASTGYHGLILEIFLIAQLTLERRGESFGPSYLEQLRRMADASLALRHPGGRMPRFGDADDARVVPLDGRRAPSHDHLLALAAGVVGSPCPTDIAAADRADAAFLLGPGRWDRLLDAPALGSAPPPAPPAPRCRSFAEAGLHVISAPRAHLVLRCGGVGQNGNGGHAHNDLLAFELSLDGRPLIVDPGSSTYRDPAERTRTRSTASHGTVAVAGEEINPIDAAHPFRLRGIATPGPVELGCAAGAATLSASHDGYARLEPAAICRRAIVVEGDGSRLRIEDRVEPADGPAPAAGTATEAPEVDVVSRLQLAAGVAVEPIAGEPGCLRLSDGAVAVRLRSDSPISPVRGWVADRYGAVREAPLLEIARRAPLPLALATSIEVEG